MGSNAHFAKLKAALENTKMPESDIPIIDNALERYYEWKSEIESVKSLGNSPEETLAKLLDSLNRYKKYIELDVIFKSESDFLYRQKGQLKLDNSVMEEFLPEIIHPSVIPEIGGLDIDVGPTKTFSSVYFKSSLDNLSNGPMLNIKSKDQDFAITKKVYLKTSFSPSFTDNNIQMSSLAYVAAECKTNLDKTMFQEASATAHDIKTSIPSAKYFLLCEWLDMAPVSTAPTDIDEVIILRKAKRLSSDTRKSFSTYSGRMKKFFLRAALGLMLAVHCLLIFSCKPSAVSGEILDGEFLFSLQVGLLENELDYFHRGGSLPPRKNSIFMYQGIIFIGNSLGHKVMEFSSYGDLVTLLYDDKKNPRPVLLSSRLENEKIVNKRAQAFPFNTIGDIAVSSDYSLLVEDHVPPERRDFDQETGTVLQRIIHRFAADGTYLDYIGQEGVGGTPFPFIVSIELTARDDLVVVAKNQNAHNVFWYNKEGERLFTVILDDAHLPAGKNAENFPSLARVLPDMNEYRLYLHINFESAEAGESDSRVYLLELPSGQYTDSFELSKNVQALPGEEGIEYIEYQYRFIGVSNNGNLFFISRNNAREQSLVIFDVAGNVKARRILRIQESDVFFSDYQVSGNGIITALFCDPDSATVYWWRVDKLLGQRISAPRGTRGTL